MSKPGGEANCRALLVGVDHYPRRLRSVGPVYPDLQGCVADVGRVEQYLRWTLSVPDRRIERLVAPLPGQCRRQCEAGRPTYENLVAALERLLDGCRPGEHVVVYYAGHGGRAPTLTPEVKGAAGLDECLVPWNIADPTARYLRDVELAVWLERMEIRRVFVTLIFDCCHSGGAARWRLRTRGIEVVDRSPRAGSAVAGLKELRAAASRRRPVRRHVELPGERRFAPSGYALLAACRPGERTVEAPSDDEALGGVFTGSLLRVLEDLPRNGTYEQLMSCVTLEVHSRFPAQTPMIEGEGDRVWMAGRHRPRRPGIEILGRGASAGSVRLATGAVHGIAEGAVLGLVWQGSVRTRRGPEPRTVLRISAAGGVSSEAKVAKRLTASRTRPPRVGDRLSPIDLGPRAARCRVALWEPSSGPLGSGKLLDRLRDELSRRTIWVRPADRGPAPLAVGLDSERFVVLDRWRRPLAWTGPPLAVSDPHSIPALAQRLDHLGRWEWTRRLENLAPDAALAGRIGANLRRLPDGWRPGSDHDPPVGDDRPRLDHLTVKVGGWVLLEINNRSAQELNFAVLDLRPDWSIAQVFPGWYGGRFQPLDPGHTWQVPLQVSLPPEMDRGTDILLILATSDPVSHRWMELPPLTERQLASVVPSAVWSPHPPPPAGEATIGTIGEWADDDGADGWATTRVRVGIFHRSRSTVRSSSYTDSC